MGNPLLKISELLGFLFWVFVSFQTVGENLQNLRPHINVGTSKTYVSDVVFGNSIFSLPFPWGVYFFLRADALRR